MSNASLAVIIPTAGRSSQLQDCLVSLNQTCLGDPRTRALVVDNNSEQEFVKLVRQSVDNFPLVDYVHCPRPGLSSARHHALEILSSDVFCYVDDDVRFSRSWLESIRSAFDDDNIAIAGGPSIPDFQGSIPPWFWDFLQPTPFGGWCCPWLSLLDIGEDIDDINPNLIWGLNFAIRREVILECGGFHIDLVPKQFMRWQGDGETGLTMKLKAKGYKAVYRQDSLLFHHCGADRLNPEYFAKRAYYQGVCNSFTELRRKLRGDEQKKDPAPQSSLLKRALRRSFNTIRNRLGPRPQIQGPQSPWAVAAADVRALCQQAEHEGYLFHQREAAADPALREWICRDNYFDVDLRELAQP